MTTSPLIETGYGTTGCNPASDDDRFKAYQARLREWIRTRPDPDAEEVRIGRQYAKGVAIQSAMRKRKTKTKARKRPAKSNVVPMKRKARR